MSIMNYFPWQVVYTIIVNNNKFLITEQNGRVENSDFTTEDAVGASQF